MTQLLPDADAARGPRYLHTGGEWRTALEMVEARRSRRLFASWPHGDGHPVMVLPGFLAGPASTRFLRQFLRRQGYCAHDWGKGFNRGLHSHLAAALEETLAALFESHERKVSLIGWSAGGIFARELARKQPEMVRNVISMGSPIRGNIKASRAWRTYTILNRGEHLRDLLGEEARLERSQPLPVPTTAIYSRSDGIVAWECCTSLTGPQTENVEVVSTHLGFGHNVEALHVIADRLAQPEGSWEPYTHP